MIQLSSPGAPFLIATPHTLYKELQLCCYIMTQISPEPVTLVLSVLSQTLWGGGWGLSWS